MMELLPAPSGSQDQPSLVGEKGPSPSPLEQATEEVDEVVIGQAIGDKTLRFAPAPLARRQIADDPPSGILQR